MDEGAAEKDRINGPMSIYEVHLGSWRKTGSREDGDYLSYHDLAVQLAQYVNELGYHARRAAARAGPSVPSFVGIPGGRFLRRRTTGSATLPDFQYFVDYLHNQGIGVIMDWVPGHFPKDAYGLALFRRYALIRIAGLP